MSTVSSPSQNEKSPTFGAQEKQTREIPKKLNCISQVRQRQGMTLRTVARRWDLEISDIRRMEQPTADLRISELLAWQRLLEVPLHELLVDTELPLSPPVLQRAQLIRLMKTIVTLRDKSTEPEAKHLIERLLLQVLEIMPELKNVGPWHETEERTNHRTPMVYQLPENS
jgi:transcriptional regulator with XRE-family HTH domain